MGRLPLADRDEELALFDGMVAGQTRRRILLLEAAGGIGLSSMACFIALLLHGNSSGNCPPNLLPYANLVDNGPRATSRRSLTRLYR